MTNAIASMRTVDNATAFAPMESLGRVNWVDTAKGVGIILVVLGHVMRGLVNSQIWSATPTNRFFDGWIYAFHMPLFFFLSGLFVVRSLKKPWLSFLSEKLRTLAYPYFVWSTITLIIKSPLGAITNRANGLTELPLILYRPVEQYWFLYSLFVLLVLISVLLRLRFGILAVLGLAILIYPGVLPLSNYGWVVMAEASTYAIYIALGVIVGSTVNLRTIATQPVSRLLIIGVMGFAIAALGGVSDLPYRDALAPLLAFAGTSAVVATAALLDGTRLGPALRLLGKYSLEIYVAHTIASAGIRIALLKFANIAAPMPQIALGTLAGLYLPILLVQIFNRLGFRYAFILPNSSQKPPQKPSSDGISLR